MKKLAVAALLTTSLALQAQVISWNFSSWGIDSGSLHAGVVDAYNWNSSWVLDGNSQNATDNNLVNNAGVATTLSLVELGNNNGWNHNFINNGDLGSDANGSSSRKMLNGYMNKGGTEATTSPLAAGHAGLTLNAIPYSVYDIYVYFSSDAAGRVGTVNIGSTTYDYSTLGAAAVNGANASLIQTTDTTGANPSANYAVFSGLTGSTQTIDNYVNQWGGIAAIQIVATPEPSSMALAVMGGFGVLLMKRRFKKS
jgi:hypothetical protein